jgi:XTP/dITP diphosphohydrolase
MRPLRRLLVATSNPGKRAELEELLAPLSIEIVAPREAGWADAVTEDGDTLEANALKKARAGAEATGLPTVADDSGLFVDALDGAPGVHSARYAGEAQDAAANCAKLLEALAGVPMGGRGAEFRCVVALVHPDGGEELFEGICRGRVASEARGGGGFGYDPLFVPEGHQITFAQMPRAEKHALSHRGRALGRLRDHVLRSRT